MCEPKGLWLSCLLLVSFPSVCLVLFQCASFYIVSYLITSSYINLLSLEARLLSHERREGYLGGGQGGEGLGRVEGEKTVVKI